MALQPEDIEALVSEAGRLGDVEQRKAFLDNACAGDLELRAAVERRLAREDVATENAPTFTGAGIPDASQLELETMSERPGSIIGPYRLMEILGQGGFGTVFLAEQEKPMRREVALKIIRLGMDTREIIARFEAERQALDMMDQKSIARVFDAGATRSGRP